MEAILPVIRDKEAIAGLYRSERENRKSRDEGSDPVKLDNVFLKVRSQECPKS